MTARVLRARPRTILDISAVIRDEAADRLIAECERRNISPTILTNRILETVIKDDLFAAVLDG